MFWTGSIDAITAAERAAFARYIADHPTAQCAGEVIANPTTAWAVPAPTTTPDVWAIPGYPGMAAPEGCEVTETIEWPEPDNPHAD